MWEYYCIGEDPMSKELLDHKEGMSPVMLKKTFIC